MDKPSVIRLADYFVVLELDPNLDKESGSLGTIRQRFPENDWEDAPFPCSIQMFCVPQGWEVTSARHEPTFFVCTLTDLMGAHQYACCLQVQDRCSNGTISNVEDDIDPSAPLYRPKVFVILSRHAYFDLFRVCLNRIFSALQEGSEGTAEQMIATLISGVQLRDRSPISFSLGSERLSVRPLLQSTVPITGDRIASLVKQLGTIHNLLLVIRAIICELKIVIESSSRARLSDAAYAIKSLLYPFEYSYTYVPVLPEMLIEYLESPTPFIMGVMKSETSKILKVDAVMIDLDIGSVTVPDGTKISPIPEPFFSKLVTSLQSVLSPELINIDRAMPTSLPPIPSSEMQDKMIRACILRFFASLLRGYRCALEVARLHNNPLIVFHKAAFMGMRCLSKHPLIHQLLEGQMFQLFVSSRGLPYRPIDVFDRLVATIFELFHKEENDQVSMMENITNLAQELLENERQEPTFTTTPKQLRTASFSLNGKETVDDSKLRDFDGEIISELIEKNIQEGCFNPEPFINREVPVPIKLSFSEEHLASNSRRLEVLATCIQSIFENKLSEARKMFCAVELSLRTLSARLALCQKLSDALNPIHRGTLPPQQFELIVRLINCALEQESAEDDHGVAYACLYLSHMYCRRLGSGAHQFAYTCIQDHPVWENQRFWEAAFFHDVHQLLRRQYMEADAQKSENNYLFSTKSTLDMWNLLEEPTAMQIVSARLKNLQQGSYSQEDLDRWNAEEESIVFGQAKHYINLMVYLRVPLDPSRLRRINKNELEARSQSTRGSLAERSLLKRHSFYSLYEQIDETTSVVSDGESGYIENVNDGDWGSVVVRWISRLIDRICSAANLNPRLTEKLNNDIPGFVAVHIDNLEQVYYESKRIAPIAKLELPRPVLFTPSEKMMLANGLRAFLLPESKMKLDASEGPVYEPISLLPAEGAIFITNYRIIFKGTPCNPLLNDQMIVRAIPLMSITKDKTISDGQLHGWQTEGIPAKVVSGLHDAIQIQSSCFQLIKIAFDEEVTLDQVEEFMKAMTTIRWPTTLPQTLFAYSSSAHLLNATLTVGAKTKYNTIRDLKKTIGAKIPLKIRTSRSLTPARDSHLKLGRTLAPSRLALGPNPTCTLPSRPQLYLNDSINRQSPTPDYLDLSHVPNNVIINPKTQPDVHHDFIKDYERLRLNGETGLTRISFANAAYEIAKSYPSQLVVPHDVSDDVFAKVAKGFKGGRFPVITWMGEGGAFLLRGASFSTNNVVVKKIKKQGQTLKTMTEENTYRLYANLMGQGEFHGSLPVMKTSKLSLAQREASGSNITTSLHSNEYQEQYLSRLAGISPSTNTRNLTSSVASSLIGSVESIETSDMASISTRTPEFSRKRTPSDLSRQALSSIRTSANKGKFAATFGGFQKQETTNDTEDKEQKRNGVTLKQLQRKNLYILGEKGHRKALRWEKSIEFVPINYPSAHQIKVSFKKLLGCVSGSEGAGKDEQNTSFLKLLDESEWLYHVGSLLSTSVSIVSLITLHNSSVALCIEDGWDSTCIISSLTQLLLDSTYRTFNGFKLLVEKEWLAFGHRFSHRANHTIGSQSSGIAPMFLLFLDCVHQLFIQNPVSFEFNDFYLRFLAYHSQSAFFRTFLLDCESDRVRIDSAAPDLSEEQMGSVWNYVMIRNQFSTIFRNNLYQGSLSTLPYPATNIASLPVWDFYFEDFLAHGAPYDLEVAETELHQRAEEKVTRGDAVSNKPGMGKLLDITKECPELTVKDNMTKMIETYGSLVAEPASSTNIETLLSEVYEKDAEKDSELDSGILENEWDNHIEQVMLRKNVLRLLAKTTQTSRSSLGKHNLIIVRHHHFEPFTATQTMACNVCAIPLPSNQIRSGVRCSLCKAVVHEKCVTAVQWHCLGEKQNTGLPESSTLDSLAGETARTLTADADNSTQSKHIIHSGLLQKKGATFKLWKPRWFTLDSRNHKMIYYDSEQDIEAKGVIDLIDLQSVECHSAGSNKTILELRTSRRSYSLLAESYADGEIWKEKIESVLRD